MGNDELTDLSWLMARFPRSIGSITIAFRLTDEVNPVMCCRSLVRPAVTSTSCLQWLKSFEQGRSNRQRRGGRAAELFVFAFFIEPMRR